MLQNPTETDHPRGELHVNIGELWAKEEWTLSMTNINDLGDLCLQLLCDLRLAVEVLSLQQLIECGDDASVDLLKSESDGPSEAKIRT